MISDEEKELILDMYNTLVGVCDGAETRDGKGFNSFDARFVRELMEKYQEDDSLTLKQWKALAKVLLKYRKQLTNLGHSPTDLKKIKFGSIEKKKGVKIKVKEDVLIIDTPYDEKWLKEFKREIPKDNRVWNNTGKIWRIDIRNKEIAERAIEITEKHFDVEFDANIPDVPFGEARVESSRVVLETEDNDEFLKRIKGFTKREYDDTEFIWSVEPTSLEEVEELEDILEEWDIDVYPDVYQYLEEKWMKFKEEKEKKKELVELSKQKSLEEDYEVDLPSDDLTLYPFQKFGVKLLDIRGKALLADEMGLGKSVMTLAHLYNHQERRPIILIVPSSVKINWKREILKWTDSGDDDIVVLEGEEGEIEKGKSWYIVNYAVLHHRLEQLEEINYKGIVVDESHYIKNKEALRTKATRKLAEETDHVYCLSGTPMPNRPVELWQQLDILDPIEEDFQTFWPDDDLGTRGFAKKYCNATKVKFGWDVNGAQNLDELQRKLRESIMIRRRKSDVLEELPEKQRFRIPMQLDNRSKYNDVVRNFKQWMRERDKEKDWGHAEVAVKMEKLIQVAWKGKYDYMIDWIQDTLSQVDKLVVFAHHKELQSLLYEDFKENAVQLVGGMSSTQRQDVIDKFTNDDDVKLIIASMKSGGEGINLQVASTAVFTEIGWTPSQHKQAEDRIHRMGQENDSVNIYYLMAEDTIEETIYKTINRKQKVVDEAIDGIVEEDKKGVIMEVLEEEDLIENEE